MMAGTRGGSYQGWINHQCHNMASDWLMAGIQASDWPIVSQLVVASMHMGDERMFVYLAAQCFY